MRKRDRLKPYVRNGNGREKSESIITAYRLAYYRVMRKPYFVLVQRGFPNLAIAAQDSRRDVQQSIIPVMAKWKTFKQWAKDMARHARGEG